MLTGGIYIGTSGWSYKHWKEIFYPPKMKPTQYLAFYAEQFKIAEINTSFYRLPKEESVINWIAQVPEGFKFCPKMSRYLTHMKKLTDPEDSLERFFQVFAPMKNRMGPVLIQLPHMVSFKYNLTENLYKLLKTKYREYSFVMEPRHQSWFEDTSLTLMAGYDIGLVISQSGEHFPYSEMITAKNIYIRFHGPAELYASSYGDEMLHEFAVKFKEWQLQGHDVWAFFNNDIHGHAFRDAHRLINMIGT